LNDPKVEFFVQLEKSGAAAEYALELLKAPDGPQRSLLYRILLARALGILLGLYYLEKNRKAHEKYGFTIDES
jgi:hypothetical protein